VGHLFSMMMGHVWTLSDVDVSAFFFSLEKTSIGLKIEFWRRMKILE